MFSLGLTERKGDYLIGKFVFYIIRNENLFNLGFFLYILILDSGLHGFWMGDLFVLLIIY